MTAPASLERTGARLRSLQIAPEARVRVGDLVDTILARPAGLKPLLRRLARHEGARRAILEVARELADSPADEDSGAGAFELQCEVLDAWSDAEERDLPPDLAAGDGSDTDVGDFLPDGDLEEAMPEADELNRVE